MQANCRIFFSAQILTAKYLTKTRFCSTMYDLTRKIGINRLRIFGRAENLFTWTKYWGFDPEIGSGSTSLGVDYGVYPQARTYTIGFNISL